MTFKEILEQINSAPTSNDPGYLIELVAQTGIHLPDHCEQTEEKLRELTRLLLDQPELARTFRSYLISLYTAYTAFSLYTDAGILPGHGIFSEAYKRLKYKILPPLQDATQTQYLISRVFYNRNDYQHILDIEESVWLDLFDALAIVPDVLQWEEKNLNQMLNALMVLSQRITAIGLEPEVVSKLPEMDDLQSPFFGLNREVQDYVDHFKQEVGYSETNEEDYQHILVMCSQCTDSIAELHKHKEKYGISIQLAFLMLRLEQHVLRLRSILRLIHTKDSAYFNKTAFDFMCVVVNAENRKYSVSKHLNESLSLLAYKITEHTSRVGEHYRSVTRSEYFAMFRSALGGGAIVAVLVMLKVLAHHWHLAPFGEAFVYSVIYGVGFIAIHLCHFTLATKQPAMTANTIAASMDENEKSDKKMLKTVSLIAEISRAQFISVIGNIIIVLPVAFILGWIYSSIFGYNIISPEESNDMIMKLHPWHSGSLFYAAVAGVLLMISGLVAGFYDNKVVYGRIPERIRQHPFLKRIIPTKSLDTFATYMSHNSGVMLGNIFLGIFLATTPVLGKLFGLPIDVRHVTLSTGNFGLALQSAEHGIPWSLAILISISLLLMGLINLVVSFGLAIYVAARSRSLQVSRVQSIGHAIRQYFRANPSAFFIPPVTPKEEKID